MNYLLLNSAVKTLLSLNHFIPLLVYSKDEKPALQLFVLSHALPWEWIYIVNIVIDYSSIVEKSNRETREQGWYEFNPALL